MADEKTTPEEEQDDTTEETTEDDGALDKGTSKEDELDLDAEIAAETQRGKPDPKKAKEAFKGRQEKRETTEEDEDDKPLTRRDIAEIEAGAYARAQTDRALELAKSLTTSDKEGQLVFLKWQNRTWPANMPLSQQIEEALAITHSKKLIGERNEALRGLKNKGTTTKVDPGEHRDGPTAGEPKMAEADKTAILAAGFSWDATKRLYKKPLKGGKLNLYRDPKSGRTFTAA